MEPRTDRLSTYFVQNRSIRDELNRVAIQDQMLIQSMGGALPEQSNLSTLASVLDVACGTGGWLIEIAKTYPHIQNLVGVDISKIMLSHASTQAKAEGVDPSVTFTDMDALFPLTFPTDTFDLVNQRFGISYLRTWEWPRLIADFQRVARPGGIIRLTEGPLIQSNSPSQVRLGEIVLGAFFRAGHLFTNEGDGLTDSILQLMKDSHLQNVQRRVQALSLHAGAPGWQGFYEDMIRLSRSVLPFARKWGQIPPDYDALCQQMVADMEQPDFVASWTIHTIWGTKPPLDPE